MIQVIMAIGTLCPVVKTEMLFGNPQDKCLKYYAECVGDLTYNRVDVAEKLRQCILKKK